MKVKVVRSSMHRMTDMYSIHFCPPWPPTSFTVSKWKQLSNIELKRGESKTIDITIRENDEY